MPGRVVGGGSLLVLLGLQGAAGCGGAPSRPAEPPVATVGVPAPAPTESPGPAAPEDPARAARLALQRNLVQALNRASDAGWVENRRIPVPGHNAVIVVYEPMPDRAPVTMQTRVDAIGAGPGNVISRESGMIDVTRTKDGKLLRDLRGNGALSVVLALTPCGANCGIPEPLVLDLTDDSFSVPDSAPACPLCFHDLDGDGVPEFDFPLVQLSIGSCSRVSCGPVYALVVEIDGYESWDGKRFAKNLKLFKPLYEKALAAARQQAKDMAPVPKAGVCPLEALRVAVQLYAYGRLTGQSSGTALAAGDAVMKGRSMGPCKKRYDLFSTPKPWSVLRRELSKTSLPTLAAERVTR